MVEEKIKDKLGINLHGKAVVDGDRQRQLK